MLVLRGIHCCFVYNYISTFKSALFSCGSAMCYTECDNVLHPLTACLLCLQECISSPAQGSLSQVFLCCSSQVCLTDTSDSWLTSYGCLFFNKNSWLRCQTPGSAGRDNAIMRDIIIKLFYLQESKKGKMYETC